MASRKPTENDVSLPFAALQLLAPPVRLVSAALWKVLKQRDVMQYGVVEEFVTSACETVPGLLTTRHQAKLALGLRARLILELCSTKPVVEVIQPHLDRIRAPVAPSTSSAFALKKDAKILRTVEHFHSLVHMFLTDPAERELFFQEEFPVEYGPKFDQELEKLLWEFLLRLDQLLPVPNLSQTVSWLAEAPPVLEECAQAATQPQLLEILLQHQTCLGHLEIAASLPPNMGDSILASLSLPPSGRVASKQPQSANQSDSTQTQYKTPLITPVFGLISNKDVPIMISARKRMLAEDPANQQPEPKDNPNFTSIKQKPEEEGGKELRAEPREDRSASYPGMKRKHPESESSEEEELASRKKSTTRPEPGDGSIKEDKAKTERNKKCHLEAGHQPEDPLLNSMFSSCLRNQPTVVIERLFVASGSPSRSGRGGTSFSFKEQRTKSPRKYASCRQSPGSEFPGLDDKENLPVKQSVSSSSTHQRTITAMQTIPGEGDDYVADSEDEATKNFKVRLFSKRYYKTKHGTFVPTLREYCKPAMTRRNFLSTASKRR